MAHHIDRLKPEQLSEESTYLGSLGGKLIAAGFIVGAVCLAVAIMLGVAQNDDMRHFQFSYLVGYVYFLSLGLGGLIFTIIQNITRASWSVVVRRLSEIIGGTIPLMILLALPIVIPALYGYSAVYHWIDPNAIAHDPSGVLAHKAIFLSKGFWAFRLLVYFVVWSLLATFFLRTSLRQDQDGNPRRTLAMWRMSAPAVLLFAVTITLFAIDVVMSLNPHWFSTIFGVYFFAGSFVGFVSLLVLIVLALQKSGRMRRTITIEHRHDLGKLIFAFLFFWGYIAFSQYMLIWYGNIPEETDWYLTRQSGGWLAIILALLFGHFIIPFLGLLPRGIKRRKLYLAFWAVWMLVIHYIDMYWLIMPTFSHDGPQFGLLDLLCFFGIGGVFIAFAAILAGQRSLVPLKDPQLAESLKFENV